VMARILATKPNAVIVLEKTPHHVLHWHEILTLFPNAFFVHIIRDPRAVVASLRAASRSFARWAPWRLTSCCSLWNSFTRAGREIARVTPNYLEIRYEDLRREGVSSLRSVFAWCGLEISDDDIEDILRRHQIDRLRSQEAPLAAWCPYGEQQNFYRKGQIDSWRSELTMRQLALVEHLTGDLMEELGYARVAPAGGVWRSAGHLLTAALDLLADGRGWRRFCNRLWPSRRFFRGGGRGPGRHPWEKAPYDNRIPSLHS